MGASDGSRLNFASDLAATAAGLQKSLTSRRRMTADPGMMSAVADVEEAVSSLCSAVSTLALEVVDPAQGDGDAEG